MKITSFTGSHFKEFIIGGFENLRHNKGHIDALNVFPVPDGDTGTNMFLTMQSAAKKTEQLQDYSLASVAEALSTGSLMGARGNSGVILSQIFRGLAHGLCKHQEATSIQVAQALQSGVETAYKAVMKPVEGTILTVTKECARGAKEKAQSTTCVLEVLQAALVAGEKALERTPDQLPILKQAGVVDAGGKGFLVILEGGIKALGGEVQLSSVGEQDMVVEEHHFHGDADITYPYCTEFLVNGTEISVDQLRVGLEPLGDSLLVVGDPSIVKVHIHTGRPGLVLEQAIKHGQLNQINISNMIYQSNELSYGQKEALAPVREANNHPIGVVAVVAGDGLVELLKSMGVDVIVTGGQTMNPSTEDILAAVEQVNADKVIILPNNSNIILAARQAQELCQDKQIAIVPTKTFPQALAAMLMYDYEQEFTSLVESMISNIVNVKTGEITYAVRDSQYNGIEIKAGDILGLVENNITSTGSEINQVVDKVLTEMITEDSELITVFYGADVQEAEAEQLSALIEDKYPDMEVELHNGGQSLYYYIIGVE